MDDEEKLLENPSREEIRVIYSFPRLKCCREADPWPEEGAVKSGYQMDFSMATGYDERRGRWKGKLGVPKPLG